MNINSFILYPLNCAWIVSTSGLSFLLSLFSGLVPLFVFHLLSPFQLTLISPPPHPLRNHISPPVPPISSPPSR